MRGEISFGGFFFFGYSKNSATKILIILRRYVLDKKQIELTWAYFFSDRKLKLSCKYIYEK